MAPHGTKTGAGEQPAPSDAGAAFLQRVRNRMARIDDMPPELRACVHEFGLTIVDAMLACGVRKARHIRHLVKCVREETRYGNGGGGRS